MKAPSRTKVLIFLIAAALLATILFSIGVDEHKALGWVHQFSSSLKQHFVDSPVIVAVLYMLVYAFMVAVSVPGMFLVTMLGGAVFDFSLGVLFVALAASMGSLTSFLATRYIFKESAEQKWREYLVKINKGMGHNGFTYMLSLRLIPVIPYYVLNVLMALTSIRIHSFFFATLIGMIPIHAVYCNAGVELAKIKTFKDVLSLEILLSLAVIAALPFVVKLATKVFSNLSKAKERQA